MNATTTRTDRATGVVRSADGTEIAFETVGEGPPLILVEVRRSPTPSSTTA